MKLFIISLFSVMLTSSILVQNNFKTQQQKFERVSNAYNLKWAALQSELKTAKIGDTFDLIINAYKAEGKLEVWIKNKSNKQFNLFKTYDFAGKSGTLGPKVIEGDLQTPEGFYYINVFNPMSTYHLSLGINYPNKVDEIRTGKDRKTGGEIYIHGNNVTVGCIPLTDDKIKEVYILAVEAKNAGQKEIPVYIYPFKMTNANLVKYGKEFPQHVAFWETIKPGYDYFEKNKSEIKFTEKSGKYVIK